MTQTTADRRWDPVRNQQRSAVVAAVLGAVTRGDAVTVADLSDEAGMSRPTFYKYFPTLGAAMLHTHRVVLNGLQTYIADRVPGSDVPASERLLATFELAFQYNREHVEVLQFFSYFDFTFRRFGLTADEHRELDEIIAESGDHTRDLFIEGQADGSINPDLPIEPTVMALSGSIVGLAQRLLIQDEYSDPSDDDRAYQAHSLVVDAWRKLLRS